MPLILALLFAIPSYGLSIVLYIMWIFFKSNGKVDLRKLSNIEKAVYHVAENEKAFGAAFDEISYDDVFDYLISNDIDWYKDPFSRYGHIEFDIQIGRRKYNVNVGKEPDMSGKGAVFNAKRAISWVDELYEWARENFGTDLRFGKYYLQDQGGFVVVDQERPVWKASDPVIVPESFGNLTRLQILRIIEKDVVSLPRSIGKMKGLKEINLNRNALMSLPKEICNLPKLEIILLNSNKLKELPAEFGALQKLDILDLSDNEIRRLPDSIVKLKNLGVFYLDGNKDLVVSPRQKKWIVELMKNGTRVSIDDEFYRQLKERFPEIPPHRKERLHWQWVEPDTVEAD